jgi:hypothetical protein
MPAPQFGDETSLCPRVRAGSRFKRFLCSVLIVVSCFRVLSNISFACLLGGGYSYTRLITTACTLYVPPGFSLKVEAYGAPTNVPILTRPGAFRLAPEGAGVVWGVHPTYRDLVSAAPCRYCILHSATVATCELASLPPKPSPLRKFVSLSY